MDRVVEESKELLSVLGVIIVLWLWFFKFLSEFFTAEHICCLGFPLKYSSGRAWER